MSFKANDYQQITLTDSFLNLSPRTRRIVEKSWAKDFADIVFPAINEERFSVLYSSRKFSRPNTPVNVIVGALMLKELSGLTDDELFEAVCCDVRYQYALHTTHLEEQPISDRTFSRFRERLYNYHLETGTWLLDEEMKHLAKVYAEFMNLHSGIKRMDSLMVSSRCKDMSRLELLYTVVANAVKLLFRLGAEELITADLRHYLEEDDLNRVIYHCKGEDALDRLSRVIADAVKLKELMSDDEWHGFPEYGLLIRVLREQTVTDESGETIARDKTEISPESLQNPSDPDATFRRKAGKSHKGYVGNVVETVGENGDGLITEYGFEKNTHGDGSFMKDYLSGRTADSQPETMITDGAYGGRENVEAAEAVNTKLITTALTGKLPDTFLAGFVFNEEGTRVLRCPMGHAPVKTTHYPKTGMCRVLFAKGCCDTCPHQGICKAKPQKKNHAVHVSKSMADRAEYLKKLSGDEYRSMTRLRNAVEGIPSVLRRRFRVDGMPVFGHVRSQIWFSFKIGAYNVMKLLRHNRRPRGYSAQNAAVI